MDTGRFALAERLGVTFPLVQAPMAGAQGSRLALAVSSAGAVGSLPCAMLGPSDMERELAAIAAAPHPCNVNFFCHTPPVFDAQRDARWRARLRPYYDELGIDPTAVSSPPSRTPFDDATADIVEAFRPTIVSFHFGLPPAHLLDRVRGWGATIMASATTVREARWLESRGVHVVIAQGLEAGGHRGNFLSSDLTLQSGTFALLPQIVGAVRVPVIAAGGIAGADGIAAALALGASGVQIGTAYLRCPETTITPFHRAALASDAAAHTALTNLYTGRPARGIMNRFMREVGPLDGDAPEFPLAIAAAAPLRAAAERSGNSDFSPLWAGQNARGCRDLPAAQLTRELAEGFSPRPLPAR